MTNEPTGAVARGDRTRASLRLCRAYITTFEPASLAGRPYRSIFVTAKIVYSRWWSWAPRVTHYNASECEGEPRERREIVDKNGQKEGSYYVQG